MEFDYKVFIARPLNETINKQTAGVLQEHRTKSFFGDDAGLSDPK